MTLYETKNSKYTYIYVSREYYDGKCLNQNRIGIGKSKEPIKRLKEHNRSSSKISVEVKFELIYKTTQDDTFFHNILKDKGYKQIKKEIFEGTENKPLTIHEIKTIIETQAVDGPWIIKDNCPIKLKQNTTIKNKSTEHRDFQWEQNLLNNTYNRDNRISNKINDNTNIRDNRISKHKNNKLIIALISIAIFGCLIINTNNKNKTIQITQQDITKNNDKEIIEQWLRQLQNCSYLKTVSQNKTTLYFYIHDEYTLQNIKETIQDNKNRFLNSNYEKIILDFPGRFYMTENRRPVNIPPIKEEIKF